MQIITEMAYPTTFSFEKLREIKTYSGKKNYIDSHLERLGVGSSRITYDVDDEKCLKLAKNKKGLAQIEEEKDKSECEIDVFARVFDCDDEYYWIEMEKARKAKKSDAKRIYGISFDYIFDFITICYKVGPFYNAGKDGWISPKNEDANLLLKDYYKWTEGNPTKYFKIADKLGYFFGSLYEYLHNYHNTWSDICDWKRIANWGIVNREDGEEMVIIDMGLSEEIYKKHYM